MTPGSGQADDDKDSPVKSGYWAALLERVSIWESKKKSARRERQEDRYKSDGNDVE